MNIYNFLKDKLVTPPESIPAHQINTLINDTQSQDMMRKFGIIPSTLRQILSEQSLTIYERCLVGDTQISLLDGTNPTIKEMAENSEKYVGKYVLSVNSLTLALEPDKIMGVKKTLENTQLIRVLLDNEQHVDCTPEHRFMMRDGSYKEAKNLRQQDSLMPLYIKDGYKQVVSIKWLEEKADTYDIQTERNHNFPLTVGIFVHNSSLYKSYSDSLQHPLMSGAAGLFSDSATVFNRQNNATLWVTSKSKEYRYQIEKMLDVINIEEVLYDWAWTITTMGDLFVQVFGEPGVGIVSMNDDNHPINLCLRGNTKIKLLDGTSVTIKEMTENPTKYIGKKLWSVNPQTKNLEVDEIEAVQKTRLNAELIRIELDNGEFVDCTPDHRFMLRGGGFKEAKDLIKGESLMPLYTTTSKNNYKKVYNPKDNKWYSQCSVVLTKEYLEEEHVHKEKTIKVVKVTFLNEKEDTYDLTVKFNHNFPVEAGVFVHNSRVDYNGRLVGFYNTPSGFVMSGDEQKLLTPYDYIHLRLLQSKRRRPVGGGKYDPNYTEFRSISIMTPDVRRLTSKYGSCFPYGTRIETDRGNLNIHDIVEKRLPIKVQSYNLETGEIEWKNVINYFKRLEEDNFIKIHFNGLKNTQIVCTKEHPFLTERGWVPAQELTIQDSIMQEATILSEDQLQVVYGLLLSDASGSRIKLKRANKEILRGLIFVQSVVNQEFFDWVKEVFKEIGVNHYITPSKQITIEGRKFISNPANNLGIHKFAQLNEIYNLFYDQAVNEKVSLCECGHSFHKKECSNKHCGCKKFKVNKKSRKKVSKELLNKLDDLGLAVWFMGDGSKGNHGIILCTDSYTKEECETIKEWLREKYNMEDVSVTCPPSTNRCHVNINKKHLNQFMDIISPYIEYVGGKKKWKSSVSINLETKRGIYPVEIDRVELIDRKIGSDIKNLWKRKVVYDIEVEDNHNFLVQGIVVHNSIFADALPIWKRLRLAEDSIMMSRISRGVLRYLYKIGVPESATPSSVSSLIDSYISELKRARCCRGDTKISLLNGTTPTIQEMAENSNEYIGKYVYSINPETKALEPDRIVNVKKTLLNTEIIRVHLDNEQHVDVTPDHPFMLRDGTFKEAQNLAVGESLMPLYTSISSILNHKVLYIEKLSEKVDTYDITTEKNHNFALTCGIFVHNSLDTSGNSTPAYQDRYGALAGLEDIIVPVWGEVNNIAIEKIGGEVDIKWIVDVLELQKQLATALKVPLPLLAGYASEAPPSLGSGSIDRIDIRFARQARRIQRALINAITRMAQIHLAYQGMDPDLNMFDINMSETSSAEEIELQDALEKGTNVATSVADLWEKMLGTDADKIEMMKYLNTKILKLNDVDLEKFIKRANPNAFGVPPSTSIPVPDLGIKAGVPETPAPEVETPPIEEPNPFRESTYKENKTSSDFKGALPIHLKEVFTLNETTGIEEKSKVRCNEEWDRVWKDKTVSIKEVEVEK